MTPYVIDNQVRRRYIAIIIVLIIASFGLGYVSGHYMAVLEGSSIPVVEEAASDTSEAPVVEESQPEGTDTKEAAPQPEVKSEVSPPARTDSKTASTASSKTTPSPPAPAPAPKPVAQVKPVKPVPAPEAVPEPGKQETPAPVVDKPAVKPSVVAAVVQPRQAVAEADAKALPADEDMVATDAQQTLLDPSDTAFGSQPRMFSVQVGLFASRENAMNLVDELKEKGFDAYLDDFVATTGEVKYNVRFGRESNRDLIQQQLNKFKQQFSTSAYIIISK